MYCNQSRLWVCDSGLAGGVRTLLQPARAQCLRLSECLSDFFIVYLIYDEAMIREATVNMETGISVGGRIINTIRYEIGRASCRERV